MKQLFDRQRFRSQVLLLRFLWWYLHLLLRILACEWLCNTASTALFLATKIFLQNWHLFGKHRKIQSMWPNQKPAYFSWVCGNRGGLFYCSLKINSDWVKVTWERSVPGIYDHRFTSCPYLIPLKSRCSEERNMWYINMRSLNYPHVFL